MSTSHPSSSPPTRHFTTLSLSRPTKPDPLHLGADSNGSTAAAALPKSISNGSVASAGSHQSSFEEAEMALDEAVKMLGSPERGGGGRVQTAPGTPAYSDFLHEYGSEEEREEDEQARRG